MIFWTVIHLSVPALSAEDAIHAANNADADVANHTHGLKSGVQPLSAVEQDKGGKEENFSEHVHMEMDMPLKDASGAENHFNSVGVDEKLGEKIPLDLPFVDEEGRSITLGEVVDTPVLLQLVFYHCPQACNMMMANLASILESVTFVPGEDYRIVTVSFDHEDDPAIASDTKSNYMNILSDEFPKDQWHYLTGTTPAIHALTSAVGFRFKRLKQHNFVHPNVLIVLSGDGTIIRYLYGLEYLPFDVSMAITEAVRGTPAISIKKLLSYCFDYDPEGKKYVFKAFRVSGVVLILLLGAFFLLLLKKGNRPSNREK